MKQTLLEKIEEIVYFAEKTEGTVSEKVMLDILHDKDETISDMEICGLWGVIILAAPIAYA